MEGAYTAIGRAVCAAQRFETILIPVFEFFKMVSNPDYLERTGGYISAGARKVPVRNVVKALAAGGNIAPDLEERLTRYAEERHLLIHRWMGERGWPADGDIVGFAPIIALAHRVESEANALSRSFAEYMVKYANPEWAKQHDEEYRERIKKLFHSVHLDTNTKGT
jgi:hypothetical protein